MNYTAISAFRERAYNEVVNGILHYWETHTLDTEFGGFRGSIDFNGNIDPKASKGAVLNARILWTFSKAYNELGDIKYLNIAKRAYDYINTYFKDKKYDGIYWELDYMGNPLNTQKYCYVQGFWMYGLCEYFVASKDDGALRQALAIFNILEEKALDKVKNGYVEAFAHDWTVTNNVRISAKDLNENKTFNTHLHLLEPYTLLYNISKDEKVKAALKNLSHLMIDTFYNQQNGHFYLFFDDDWNIKGDLISYGHDIEGAWLLWEAAKTLGDRDLLEKAKPVVLNITRVSIAEGIDTDGGQFYEGNTSGVTDFDKHWWPQAEAVIGCINAWQMTSDETYYAMAEKVWNFIEQHIVDKDNGEWLWKVNKNRQAYTTDVRAGFWKCPYHNSRACFEILNRLPKP